MFDRPNDTFADALCPSSWIDEEAFHLRRSIRKKHVAAAPQRTIISRATKNRTSAASRVDKVEPFRLSSG